MFVSEFELGQIVFLKTDPEQNERMVTQVRFKGNGAATYFLAFGSQEETEHYAIEISKEKDLFKSLNITNKECK